MEIRLSETIGQVKLALVDAASNADKRRLRVFGDKIPCRPGCAGCCRRLIKVTMAEALILYEHLQARGQWAEVRAKAEGQVEAVRYATPASWFMMNRACPVLDEHSRCAGYPVRPALCSTHFVQSSPTLCDPHSVAGGRYEPVQFNDLVESFLRRLVTHTAGSGILQLELPLPVALLLAERINVQAGLDLEKVVSLFFNEL